MAVGSLLSLSSSVPSCLVLDHSFTPLTVWCEIQQRKVTDTDWLTDSWNTSWMTMVIIQSTKCWKTALKLRLHTHFYIEKFWNTIKLICISAFWQVTIKSFNIWSIRHMTSLSPVTCVMWNLEVCAISAFRNNSCLVDGFNRKPWKKNKSIWLSYINYVKLWRNNQSCLFGHVCMYRHSTVMPWSSRHRICSGNFTSASDI